MSARSARSAKKSAVRIAESFSATGGRDELVDAGAVPAAGLPDGLLERGRQAQRVGGDLLSRLRHLGILFTACGGESKLDPEGFGHVSEVPSVECDQVVGHSVHSRLEYHLVVWVAQLRPPEEAAANRFGHRAECRDDGIDPGLVETGDDALGRIDADRFVLERERHGKKQREPTLQRAPDQSRRGAAGTSQGGYDHIGVEDQTHLI